LNQLFFKPFLRFFEERQKKITEDEGTAVRLHEVAEQRRIQLEEGLRKGNLEALEEKGRIQDAAVHSSKEMIQTTQQEVDTELRTIKGQIVQESEQALSELKRSHGQMAQMIAEKILGRKLNKEG
jgi:F0F1-type ATP synthase membrane subunit b/b'